MTFRMAGCLCRALKAAGPRVVVLAAGLVGACAVQQPRTERIELSPQQIRARVVRALPASVSDRAGWAGDIQVSFTALGIEPSDDNICSVVAVTEQESSFRADPVVPNLPAITWKEIDARAEGMGVPRLLVHAALRLDSPNGKSYAERIDAAKTERELSETFEDFIGMVPMGGRLFANRNPVRTGGPMQVSIAFAQAHASDEGYPYPAEGGVRREVFTRRGGLHFGIAHLLDYPASYERALYRFADFNAGRYASRNAAFQNAVSRATGIPLALDGDLVSAGGSADTPGPTEVATRALARRLDIGDSAVRRALERGADASFEETSLYERVFEWADRQEGRRLPRALVPKIALKGPKITRKLTTEWFANRVDERRARCMTRLRPRVD
jgi:hypothetical protein